MSNQLPKEEGKVNAFIARLTNEEKRVLKAIVRSSRTNEKALSKRLIPYAVVNSLIEMGLLKKFGINVKPTPIGESVADRLW